MGDRLPKMLEFRMIVVFTHTDLLLKLMIQMIISLLPVSFYFLEPSQLRNLKEHVEITPKKEVYGPHCSPENQILAIHKLEPSSDYTCTCTSTFDRRKSRNHYFHIDKRVVLFRLNSTKRWFVSSLVESGPVVLETCESHQYIPVFSLFRYYLSLEKGIVLHLKNIESPIWKDVFAKVGSNWPIGSGK